MCEERRQKLHAIRSGRLPGWRQVLTATQIELDRRFDDLLRRHANQSHALSDPLAAKIMVGRLQEFHGVHYDLCAYSVMSNHVHAELDMSVQLSADWQVGQTPASYFPFHKVINMIKGGSSRYINQALGTTGTPLWAIRYRDRFIRGERHLANACRYTRNNAVAAKLVERWEDHPFSGGMTEAELAERQQRRVYPDEGLWMERLREFDARRG